MTTPARTKLLIAGVIAGALALPVLPALAGHGAGPHPPGAVAHPGGLPGPHPSLRHRVDIVVDYGAVIDAWATGELLVNESRSSVRYNQHSARLLFYCETPLVLEVTLGGFAAGQTADPVYDAANTRACAPGEALYASSRQGIYCQATAVPFSQNVRDPKLRAFSEIILGGPRPLALLGVCVGAGVEVLPAKSQAVLVPETSDCGGTASAVRYRGQGRAGYTQCPQ
ncbi:MAG: hypothetical protein ACTSY1_05340 [Alphaproteobacteria bacterium]